MEKISVTWKTGSNPPYSTLYFVNDSPVGEDDAGFDRVLDIIRSRVKIEVTLKINSISSLGGEDITDSFPFKGRYDELVAAVGKNSLVFNFSD